MFFKNKKAPEIIGIDDKAWINSAPLSLDKLKGKVILLEFWTYSCVNCLRTLPALKNLWKKYKDKRFVIIGVHTPEFDFEKILGNVKYAVRKNGIEFPVASDPDRINWERYGNTYWPRTALINGEGKLVFEHVGESGYDQVEEKIIEELKKIREIKGEMLPMREQKREYSPIMTPETYVGSLRNNGLGSSKVCTKEGCDEYADNGNYTAGVVCLQGDWNQEQEFVEYMGKPEKGWIALKYYASEVNVVLSGLGMVEILLDGYPLPKAYAGKDIEYKSGKSYVHVSGADIYNLVKEHSFQGHIIKLLPDKHVKVYAYTFG
ncbi:MAG: redoxin family protein [archaeon]